MLSPNQKNKPATILIGDCNMAHAPEDTRVTRFPRSDEVQAVEDHRVTTFPRSEDVQTITGGVPHGFTPSQPHQEQHSTNYSTKDSSLKRALPRLSIEERPLTISSSIEKRQATSFWKEGSPWIANQKFASLGTSGTTYLAQRLNPSRDLVVVREHRISGTVMAQTLIQTSHMNVVKLREAFVDGSCVWIVYEQMEVSLPRLRSSIELRAAEIATICKEILGGLLYIHQTLHVAYAGFLYKNVFFDRAGCVKIGNIGATLMANEKPSSRSNAGSLGNLLLHIMQPGTMHGHPEETSLTNPENWDKSIVEFQKATEDFSIEQLRGIWPSPYLFLFRWYGNPTGEPNCPPRSTGHVLIESFGNPFLGDYNAHMESPCLDRAFLRDKRKYFRGRAKIYLEHLDYRGISSRGKVDEKHIDNLVHLFQVEGCMRLHEPENYVPGLISREELSEALSYNGLKGLNLLQDGEPPSLSLPEGMSIKLLHGEHRMRAAEKFLQPSERWWVVMLYIKELDDTTQNAIREEYSHQLKFTDGDIYRNIRLHARRQDAYRVKKWEARLSSNKKKYLSLLNQPLHHPIRDGLNRNLPFVGLWDALEFGALSRILPLHCPQEFAHYLGRIYEIWNFILPDSHLHGLLDPVTVSLLETLTPEASHDASLIIRMMDRREAFPGIENTITREEIKQRILQVKGRLISFYTFFDDWKYMEILVKCLRPLLPSSQNSLRDNFFSHFKNTNHSANAINIQTGERRYRRCYSSLEQQKLLAYLMMFLAAMRDFPILSQVPPRKPKGEKKPLIEGSPEERQSSLAQLAVDVGFKSDEIESLLAADPDIAAAKSFLRRSRPLDRYAVDEKYAIALSVRIGKDLKKLATPISSNLPPEFSCQLDRIAKDFRCGIPDNLSYKNDREHLYIDVIYNYSPVPRSNLTSLAFQRDIFVSYFGIITLPGLSQPGDLADSINGGPGEAILVQDESASVEDFAHLDAENVSSRISGVQQDDDYFLSHARSIISPIGSSVYGASQSECSSQPMSDFPDYLKSIEAAIWPYNQVPESPQNEAGEDIAQLVPRQFQLAPGFERALAKSMNEFHSLENTIRPSDAAKEFLSSTTVILVFLWKEKSYIKFQPVSGQRWTFERTVESLADRDYQFVWIDKERLVVNDLSDIWAVGLDARLVFSGPKTDYTQESLESFLKRIDNQPAL